MADDSLEHSLKYSHEKNPSAAPAPDSSLALPGERDIHTPDKTFIDPDLPAPDQHQPDETGENTADSSQGHLEPKLNSDGRPKDTKEYVTNYAFTVAPSLLGKPIARPWRRACAQMIDLIAIGFLAQLPSPILGLLTSLAFFRLSRKGNKNIRSARAKWGLRVAGMAMLFIVTIIVVDTMRSMEETEIDPDEQSIAQAIIYGANWLKWQDCSGDFDCQRETAVGVGQGLFDTGAKRRDVQTQVDSFLRQRSLSDEQRATIKADYLAAFVQEDTNADFLAPVGSETVNQGTTTPEEPLAEDDHKSEKFDHSALNWIRGFIADDLGLSFGWAALYHSIFTAWFGGRTMGKRLLKIRVVKLDGSQFSLWESFGRYGGYGAGFATGLLGFAQVYWDANRQAIQDKISETVVIFEKK